MDVISSTDSDSSIDDIDVVPFDEEEVANLKYVSNCLNKIIRTKPESTYEK